MSTPQSSSPKASAQHQLAFWERVNQAQPLEAEASAEVFPLSGKGTVYSYTTVTAPAEPFEPYAPYVLALVQLDEGPLITAQLTDLDSEPQIGMRVELAIRKLRTDGPRGIIVYGQKFRPLLVPEAGDEPAS